MANLGPLEAEDLHHVPVAHTDSDAGAYFTDGDAAADQGLRNGSDEQLVIAAHFALQQDGVLLVYFIL